MTDYPNYPGGHGPVPSGQMPYPPQRTPDWPPTRPAPPRAVRTAFTLWIASIIVGLLAGTLSFALTNPLAASGQRMHAGATSGVSQAQLDTILNVSLIIGAVFGVLFLALEVFFVVKMRAGRNWARIVLTVLAGLDVLVTLLGILIQRSVGVTQVLGVLPLVLIVAATMFMYRGTANPYFEGRLNQ